MPTAGSRAALFATMLVALPSALAADAQRVAVFDFELIDTSLEGSVLGVQAAETARLERLGTHLRDTFAGAPGFEVVDIAPVAAKARSRNLQRCGSCDRTFAAELDAELAVTGTVQKVSNLILNVNVYVRDVESGELVQAMSADIRGNTDESWQRGLEWLIRNRLNLEP